MTQVIRATFEAIFSAKEKLRSHLDLLAKENRPLKNEAERESYFRELSYATLGQGHELTLYFYGKSVLIRKDLESFGRWMGYANSDMVLTLMNLYGGTTPNDEYIPIHRLWSFLRDQLFTIYPLALKVSASMSREQEGHKKNLWIRD